MTPRSARRSASLRRAFHGEQDHGNSVYESVLRVPLIIRAPGVRSSGAGRVGEVVRVVDVMPTVLDLLGLPMPAMDGVSLVDRLAGARRPVDLVAYAESLYPQRFGWSPLFALRAGRYKLIDAPRPELYDLERDPFEERNRHGEHPRLAALLTRRLRAVSDAAPPPGQPDPRAILSTQLVDQLGALGYVASRATTTATEPRDLPDPKDCIALHNRRDDAPARPAIAGLSRCD